VFLWIIQVVVCMLFVYMCGCGCGCGCGCVCCHCQLSVEAQLSRDVLLTEFVQLYVQLRQVNRLIHGLFAAVQCEGQCLYLPGSFCARFVLHLCYL